MPRHTPIEGQVFGRLTVVSHAGSKNNKSLWNCTCTCGGAKQVVSHGLTSGHTQSCGCLRNEANAVRGIKHGHSPSRSVGKRSPTYSSWSAMCSRCNNPKATSYKDYGAKGIKVCKRWLKFENFLADMGERPEGMTLDRERVTGDYKPSNCRWATRAVQANNTSANKFVMHNGVRITLSNLARLLDIPLSSISNGLLRGLSLEEIVSARTCPHCQGRLPKQGRKK